jgi:hypothetical protein
MRHVRRPELEAGLEHIRKSPTDAGTLEMIVRRPAIGEREVLVEGEIDPAEGLVGDMWRRRGSRDKGLGGTPDASRQVMLMNARCAALVAQDPDRWALGGDQLYVDFDLSADRIPAGTRLRVGSAVLEVTGEPHLGCTKFQQHFGWDAVLFVNSRAGRALRLRGMSARVLTAGTVRTGDTVCVLAGSDSQESGRPVHAAAERGERYQVAAA